MLDNNDKILTILEKLKQINDNELIILVKELIEERNYLSKIANLDSLTGLNNRRVLEHIHDFSGVIMIDIDDFKSVNDTFGHDIGDYVLKSVAYIIKSNVRANDIVFRFGGDEFTIVFVNCLEEVMIDIGEKIREDVTNTIPLPNPNYKITISMGFASKTNTDSLESVIKKADVALYSSKKGGKNRLNFYKKTKI